ncbi:MAG: antitoxin family protein [Dehalococcoidia bacterium]
MVTTFEAVYEGGVLRPLNPISLGEGSRVSVIIIDESGHGVSLEERLDQIASMPLQGKTDPFSGEDHDRALYGEDRDS